MERHNKVRLWFQLQFLPHGLSQSHNWNRTGTPLYLNDVEPPVRDRDILTHAVHVWRRLLSASAHFTHNPYGPEWLTNKRLNYGHCEVLWATRRLAILRIAPSFFSHKKNISSFICFWKRKTKEKGVYCKIRTLTSLENSAEGAFYLASGVWMRFESDDLMLLNQEG